MNKRNTVFALLLLSHFTIGAFADPCATIAKGISQNKKIIAKNHFVFYRDFHDYKAEFGVVFWNILNSGTPNKPIHWMDLGAGDALPQRQVLLGKTAVDPLSVKGTAVGVNFPYDEAYSKDLIQFQKHLGTNPFRYLGGKYFHEVSDAELGQADLMTDFFGVLSYTPHLSEDLGKALRALKPGGTLLMLHVPKQTLPVLSIQSSHKTELSLAQYLTMIPGIRVVSDRSTGNITNVIEVERTEAGHILVPELELVAFQSGTPPRRSYIVREDEEAELRRLRLKYLGEAD